MSINAKDMQRPAFAPPPDTYITVSIDFDATLKYYCGSVDDIAAAALRHISSKTYVGHCIDVRGCIFYSV